MPILEDNPKARIKKKASLRTRAKARLKSKKKSSKGKAKPKRAKEEFFNLSRFSQALIMISIFVAIISAGTYYFLHYVAFGFDKNFYKIDKCLDSGGRWDYATKSCIK